MPANILNLETENDPESAFEFAQEPEQEIQNQVYKNTTDLVRLYLQDIGRVPLLEKDEEVKIAQKIQRYNSLLELRNSQAAKGNEVMKRFVELIDTHDRLVAKLTHRPSKEQWAKAAGIEVSQLKQAMTAGKQTWASLAGIEVEELDLIQKAGIQAKNQMISSNLRLVVSIAKKYQNRGLELLDLIQEGTLGLERAVSKFDPTKGYRFSTYAYWWIRQGITRAIASSSRTIRLPVHITEKLNKIKKAQRKISQEKGRIASIEDLAQELHMTSKQVRQVLMRVPRSVSLEIKVGKDKDTPLGDLLETDSATPEELLLHEALQKDLEIVLADLTRREREVIELRYGFKDGKVYSLTDISRTLDLSRERVRQIETKAMSKLRQPKNRNQVLDYFQSC